MSGIKWHCFMCRANYCLTLAYCADASGQDWPECSTLMCMSGYRSKCVEPNVTLQTHYYFSEQAFYWNFQPWSQRALPRSEIASAVWHGRDTPAWHYGVTLCYGVARAWYYPLGYIPQDRTQYAAALQRRAQSSAVAQAKLIAPPSK